MLSAQLGADALTDKIDETQAEIERINDAVDAYDIDSVKSSDREAIVQLKESIEALKSKIDELLADENMGEAEKAKLNEYKAQCDNLIEIIHTPVKYLSLRIFWFIWDAIVWLVNHIVFIFNWLFTKLK